MKTISQEDLEKAIEKSIDDWDIGDLISYAQENMMETCKNSMFVIVEDGYFQYALNSIDEYEKDITYKVEIK